MKTAGDIVKDKQREMVTIPHDQKDQQFKELNAFVSWEYYENWKWGRKKKK